MSVTRLLQSHRFSMPSFMDTIYPCGGARCAQLSCSKLSNSTPHSAARKASGIIMPEDLKEEYPYLYKHREFLILESNYRVIKVITNCLDYKNEWVKFGTQLFRLIQYDIGVLEGKDSPTSTIIEWYTGEKPKATLEELVNVFYHIGRKDICFYVNQEFESIDKGFPLEKRESPHIEEPCPAGIGDEEELPIPVPPPSPSADNKELHLSSEPQELRSITENNSSHVTNEELDQVERQTSQYLALRSANTASASHAASCSSCQLNNSVTRSHSFHSADCQLAVPENSLSDHKQPGGGARPSGIGLSQTTLQEDSSHQDRMSVSSWPERNFHLFGSSSIASSNTSLLDSSSPPNSHCQPEPRQRPQLQEQQGGESMASGPSAGYKPQQAHQTPLQASIQAEVKQSFKNIPLPIPEPTLNFPRVFVIYDKVVAPFVKHLLVNLKENHVYFQVDNSMRHFYKHGFQYNNIVEWLNECFKFEFILVSISCNFRERVENVTEEVVQRSNENSLNLRYIYSLMQNEYYRQGSRNSRFIPLLMKGASVSDIPTWLQGRRIFRWPEDYHDLFMYLLGRPRRSGPVQGTQPDVKKQSRNQ